MRLAQHGNSIEQERSVKRRFTRPLGAVKAAPCRAIKKVGVRRRPLKEKQKQKAKSKAPLRHNGFRLGISLKSGGSEGCGGGLPAV